MRNWNRISIAGALCGLLLCSTSFATITDDINPLGHLVYVGLVNNDGVGYKGVVHVTVQLDGAVDTKTVPFTISPEGELTITASFPGEVLSVISATIEERPLTL